MKTSTSRFCAVLLLVLFSVQSTWATCGGGGGGGVGGMSHGGSSGGAAPVVYTVPWKNWSANEPVKEGLVLYWFPATQKELSNSSLKTSRQLSLYAAQCVSMKVADYRAAEVASVIGDSKPPVAVLTTADGSVIKKAEGTNNYLKAEQVEKLVESEVKQRETALDTQMKDAKEKAKAGDNAAAIKIYQAVAEEKCLFPKKAKDASKELKKLGVAELFDIFEPPVFEKQKSALIEQTMVRGLRAEIAERYVVAERLYSQAHQLDPADPTPLRYLGELYRHHTGDWDKARTTFESILKMPADPLSRAVALHGLGKITIHEGEFKKGLGLMEQSIGEFPLALTYRNLAVYWNSEGDPAKGNEYTKLAIALDPHDKYNVVFAAVFMAANGQKEEALKIARANINMLPASYNLAGIFAQNGQKEKALQLLRRHFYRYERYQAVGAKEMMEARVDAVFDSLREDKDFLALTSGADGMLPMPMKNMTGSPQNK